MPKVRLLQPCNLDYYLVFPICKYS